jgi:hypothetical protein
MQGVPVCQIPRKMIQAKNLKYTTVEMYTDITAKPQGKKDHFEDVGRERRILLKRTSRKEGGEGVERIHVAYDREKLRAFVNTVRDHRDS